MHKILAVALLGSVALMSPVSAQTVTAEAEQSFQTLLAEAKAKPLHVTDSSVVTPSLSAAEWYWAQGAHSKAADYLNYARGKLGLSKLPADIRVVDRGTQIR